jgi:hypothetical protein
MLTVEELVIESLYHRLVLVNVKKQQIGPSPSSHDGTNLDDEIDDDVADVAEGTLGGGGDAERAGSSETASRGGLGKHIHQNIYKTFSRLLNLKEFILKFYTTPAITCTCNQVFFRCHRTPGKVMAF